MKTPYQLCFQKLRYIQPPTMDMFDMLKSPTFLSGLQGCSESESHFGSASVTKVECNDALVVKVHGYTNDTLSNNLIGEKIL